MATVNFISYSHQSRTVLSRVTAYVMQDQKTAEGEWVSGQNCLPQLAAREFTATREAYRKDSPVWFYHYTQSFHPREPVTPALAHRIAKEFASQAWPDSEVLIATHVDAAHIHSHFLVNAVCHESGKMLRQGPNTLHRLRQLSDGLCMKYGLSVLPQEQKQAAQGMSTREYRSAERGQSWKLNLAIAIDKAMETADNRDHFIRLMKWEGYAVRWEADRKYITYTTPDGNKCRDKNLHETKYRKENMEHEFRKREALRFGDEGTTETNDRQSRSRAASRDLVGLQLAGNDRFSADAGQQSGPDSGESGSIDNRRAAADLSGYPVGAAAGGRERDAGISERIPGSNENRDEQWLCVNGESCESDGETGWEYERSLWASHLGGAEEHTNRISEADLDQPAAKPDLVDLGIGATYLVAHLSRLKDDQPIEDSTTKYFPPERKKNHEQSM